MGCQSSWLRKLQWKYHESSNVREFNSNGLDTVRRSWQLETQKDCMLYWEQEIRDHSGALTSFLCRRWRSSPTDPQWGNVTSTSTCVPVTRNTNRGLSGSLSCSLGTHTVLPLSAWLWCGYWQSQSIATSPHIYLLAHKLLRLVTYKL